MILKIPTKVTSTRSTQSLRTCYRLSRTNITKPPPIPSTMNSKISPNSSPHSRTTLKQPRTLTTATRTGARLSLRSTRCSRSTLWLQLLKFTRHQTDRRDHEGWGEPQYFASSSLLHCHPGNGRILWDRQPTRPSPLLLVVETRRLYPEILRTNSRFRFQHQSPFGLLGLPRMLRSSRHQRLHQSQESRARLGLQHA